jgi:DNA polymerase I
VSPSVTPPASPRVFLIDGYALIYRAFFALIARPLTTGRGENSSAAWGIVNFLEQLRKKHHPEYIGWVHDSGLSFRHEKYPEYKATREKLSDELQADFDRGVERIRQILEAYRIAVLEVDGYEADDVIGTLAPQGVKAGLSVVIVSGDKDFHQLVGPGVWLLNPGRGGPAGVEEQWVGVENGDERLGVAPEHVTDYLALVGDASDNVPGVPGIGDKTARELITAYGSLENILAHAESVSKKRVRESLLANHDIARLSKELVTIRTDVPIALDTAAMQVREPDVPRLRTLFVELEFHTLAKGLVDPEVQTSPEQPAAPRPQVRYTAVTSPAMVDAIVKRARAAPWAAVDTETVLEAGAPNVVDPLRSRLVGISLCFSPGEAYYFPLAHRTRKWEQGTLALPGHDEATDRPSHPQEHGTRSTAGATPAGNAIENLPPLGAPAMQSLRAFLEDEGARKTAQNGKYDLLVLRNAGYALRGLVFDTMIASYLLDPGRRSHSLDILALELLGHRMTSYEEVCGKGSSAIGFDEVTVAAATDYSCEDVDITLQLSARFSEDMAHVGATHLLDDLEMPLLPVLADMEWAGIAIDIEAFAALKERFARERARVEQEIHTLAGGPFNINSNAQLREILFVKLGLPILKKTSSGASTDATVLQQLAEEGHALPALLMEYRELSKLESTYIDTLPALVNPRTGRIHTSFNQTVAATGRLSSSDPNLQNIPVRRELGRAIRKAFIPRKGWVMIAADYSQIELRLLAHLSQDPVFLDAFRAGGDIHRETAARIFGVQVEDVSSEMRSRAKTINFATIYGQGPHALSRQLRITHAEAREFIDRYFERFAGVRRYLDSCVESARTTGYVETILGRRRYIPELRDRNFNIRAFGERTAQNTPIQGSAADLIKLAMIQIASKLRSGGFEGQMLLQVHDELVFEAPVAEVERLSAVVKREMEGATPLSVPLLVEIGTGANWLETRFS